MSVPKPTRLIISPSRKGRWKINYESRSPEGQWESGGILYEVYAVSGQLVALDRSRTPVYVWGDRNYMIAFLVEKYDCDLKKL